MNRAAIHSVIALSAILAYSPSNAAHITKAGNTVTVQGLIGPGDGAQFEQVAPKGSYRTVVLSSPGAGEGGLEEAVAMARNIKATGATTVVNAAQSLCGSACTLLFVAGAQRVYTGGNRIAERVDAKGKTGLAFHQGRSPRGTALMASVYSEMGVAAGADLSSRSPFETLFYVSGATALSTGVATSLGRP